MAYTIVFLRGEEELDRTPWDGDLGSAKTHAIDQFKLQYDQNHATSVIVIDFDDKCESLSCHPK
jgi:hypothetical protein